MNDVAFLVMGLTAHGRRDLASALLTPILSARATITAFAICLLFGVSRPGAAMVEHLAVEDAETRRESGSGRASR